jgi:hypothetical protein
LVMCLFTVSESDPEPDTVSVSSVSPAFFMQPQE